MDLQGLLFWLGIVLPTLIVVLFFSLFLICWFRQGCHQPCWFSKHSAAEEAARKAALAEVNQRYGYAATPAGIIPRSGTRHSHLSLTNSDSSGAVTATGAAGFVVVSPSCGQLNKKIQEDDNGLFVLAYRQEEKENEASWDKYKVSSMYKNKRKITHTSHSSSAL